MALLNATRLRLSNIFEEIVSFNNSIKFRSGFKNCVYSLNYKATLPRLRLQPHTHFRAFDTIPHSRENNKFGTHRRLEMSSSKLFLTSLLKYPLIIENDNLRNH